MHRETVSLCHNSSVWLGRFLTIDFLQVSEKLADVAQSHINGSLSIKLVGEINLQTDLFSVSL